MGSGVRAESFLFDQGELTLSLVANYNGISEEKHSLAGGHAFLVVQNKTAQNYHILDYVLHPGESATLGFFGGGGHSGSELEGELAGAFINREALEQRYQIYKDFCYISCAINQPKLDQVARYMRNNTGYSFIYNNCTTTAIMAWFAVCDEPLRVNYNISPMILKAEISLMPGCKRGTSLVQCGLIDEPAKSHDCFYISSKGELLPLSIQEKIENTEGASEDEAMAEAEVDSDNILRITWNSAKPFIHQNTGISYGNGYIVQYRKAGSDENYTEQYVESLSSSSVRLTGLMGNTKYECRIFPVDRFTIDGVSGYSCAEECAKVEFTTDASAAIVMAGVREALGKVTQAQYDAYGFLSSEELIGGSFEAVMDLKRIVSPLKLQMSANITMDMLGMTEEMTMVNGLSENADGTATEYNGGSFSSYGQATSDAVAVDKENLEEIKSTLRILNTLLKGCMDHFSLDESGTILEGHKCYVVYGTLDGSLYDIMMANAEQLSPGVMQELTGKAKVDLSIIKAFLDQMHADITLYVDMDTFLPVALYADCSGSNMTSLSGLFVGAGLEMSGYWDDHHLSTYSNSSIYLILYPDYENSPVMTAAEEEAVNNEALRAASLTFAHELDIGYVSDTPDGLQETDGDTDSETGTDNPGYSPAEDDSGQDGDVFGEDYYDALVNGLMGDLLGDDYDGYGGMGDISDDDYEAFMEELMGSAFGY